MSHKSYVFMALLGVLCASAPISGSPPTLTLPNKVTGAPGAFICLPANTSGKTVAWCVLDPGLNLFPAQLLKDTRTAVVTSGKTGTYRVLAITASGDELSEPVICTVTIAAPAEVAPTPAASTPTSVTLSDLQSSVIPIGASCGPNGCTPQVPNPFSFRRFQR